MTTAVCLECGRIKRGAWTSCPDCGFEPCGPDQLAQAVLVSDHFLGREVLEAMGERCRRGEPWQFPQGLLDVVRERIVATVPFDELGHPLAMDQPPAPTPSDDEA